MATLVVEDGSGLATANSYATVAEADDYHASRCVADTSAWTAAAADRKAVALIVATALLDREVCWDGWPVAPERQALRLPQDGLRTRTGGALPATVIPVDAKDATAELARLLLERDRLAAAGEPPVRAQSIGALSITYADADAPPAVVPESVRWRIRHLIRDEIAVLRA